MTAQAQEHSIRTIVQDPSSGADGAVRVTCTCGELREHSPTYRTGLDYLVSEELHHQGLAVPEAITRAMFARGAFSKADAAAAGATLAAYAVGLVPFVLIRSAVATFYARKDTATPVKASLTGLTINMGLKLLLMGAFAQIGLALATAVGAWVNLLLVLGFAVRAGYLELNRELWQALFRFAVSGVVLATALWFTARFAASHFEAIRFRDETTLLMLIGVGALVYPACVLLLFGPRWLKGLVKG